MHTSNVLAAVRFLAAMGFLLFPGCRETGAQKTADFKAKNVVIVVADGERYIETWGDPEHRHTPQMAALAKDGAVFTAFSNNGQTCTVPGHTALLTGYYETDMDNAGQGLPSQPSLLQVWRKQTRQPASAAWIVTSKSKLAVLGNTMQADWKDQYQPALDCENREDLKTFDRLLKILRCDHPRLVLVNFRDPDVAGHANDFAAYVKAIREVDEYAAKLWNFLQSDPFYANQTAFFLTNDHGRHSGADFAGHNCDCEGCRHIMLLALGPDFRKGAVVTQAAEQIDLPVTAARIMGCTLPNSKGRVLTEMFTRAQPATH